LDLLNRCYQPKHEDQIPSSASLVYVTKHVIEFKDAGRKIIHDSMYIMCHTGGNKGSYARNKGQNRGYIKLEFNDQI